MNVERIQHLLDRAREQRLLVIGDVRLDELIRGKVSPIFVRRDGRPQINMVRASAQLLRGTRASKNWKKFRCRHPLKLVWLGKDIQMKLATEGLCIPMVKGTADAIQNPFYEALALEVNHSDWICKGAEHFSPLDDPEALLLRFPDEEGGAQRN
jgi:hypothetical protein